jgi:hypothetical protein
MGEYFLRTLAYTVLGSTLVLAQGFLGGYSLFSNDGIAVALTEDEQKEKKTIEATKKSEKTSKKAEAAAKKAEKDIVEPAEAAEAVDEVEQGHQQ